MAQLKEPKLLATVGCHKNEILRENSTCQDTFSADRDNTSLYCIIYDIECSILINITYIILCTTHRVCADFQLQHQDRYEHGLVPAPCFCPLLCAFANKLLARGQAAFAKLPPPSQRELSCSYCCQRKLTPPGLQEEATREK